MASAGAGRPQVLQYGPLQAEKRSTLALTVRPCRAELAAWGAVQKRLS
jgi:hypothetical protein